MTKEEALNKPIPVLVGFLANIYEDCQCTCYCKFEAWIDGGWDEEDAKRYAREHENKCKKNGIYDNCVERIAFERVLNATKKEIPKKVLFNKNTDDVQCPLCHEFLGNYSVRRRYETEYTYCPFCGQRLDWKIEDENSGDENNDHSVV